MVVGADASLQTKHNNPKVVDCELVGKTKENRGVVQNVLEKSPIGKSIARFAPGVDIAMDVMKGDFVKVGIKGTWALIKGPIAAMGPAGVGVVIVGEIVLGLNDIFDWW